MALTQLAPLASQRSVPMPTTAARLTFMDNLRTLVVTMVVVHHAGQAYGPTGDEWPLANPTRAAILEPFFIVNAAFGLGLLFLIAGYFTPVAYDRKGAGRFLGDRLVRLGVPLLAVSLALFLPLAYATEGGGQPFGAFLAGYLRRPEAGHMWFLSALLLYVFGYAGWRWATRAVSPPSPPYGAPPGHRAILGYALGLAAVSFLVRVWFPIDRWVDLAPFIRIEPAHQPQYLSMFIVGIVAARRDWLRRLPTRTGMTWLVIGLSAAALPYGATILGMLTPLDIDLGVDGGLSLGALVSSLIEALIAVGLSLGLLTLFRERAHWRGTVARELASLSYAIYIIHIVPVVGLQFALQASPLPPLVKFAIVALLAVPLCFLLAYGLRRLPWVRQVI